MTSRFEAFASAASSRAADPATNAAEAEVPEIVVVPPPTASTGMPTPGAAMNAAGPKLLPDQRLSAASVADTPTTCSSPAG